MTLAPGIYTVTPEEYHADKITVNGAATSVPTLSASIATILINRSPAHARAAHPLLNPDHEREDDPKFDVGTCAHELLLHNIDLIAELDYPDWRTKEAKLARDEARASNLIPLLTDQAARVRAMVAAARQGIASHSAQPPLFTDGQPEQTLIWTDDHGVVCRARLDWLHNDHAAIDDLKTTSASANPAKWERTMYGIGADVQVAFYRRGVERLTGVRPVFRYVVIEAYPPYEFAVVDLAPSALALADAKVQTAIDLWATCLEDDVWPGYSRRVASIEVPTFEEMRWLEREETAA